ncbi:MAG: helix-turn-helix transcriptional regulator [Acidimicrobiia bacterium]
MTESQPGPAAELEAVASLGEPLRRALYQFVVSAGGLVNRDQAADGVGVSRQVAAYHLDRLAEDGLLAVEFRRLNGRVGPGAGRPSKLYRRSDRVYDVSVPPRRYELAARIMLTAIGAGRIDPDVVRRAAHEVGAVIGRDGLAEALTDTGYEPALIEGETRFRNCPFHVLRDQDRAITCELNLALVEGMVQGAESDAEAALAPEDGYCCVRLRPATDTRDRSSNG